MTLTSLFFVSGDCEKMLAKGSTTTDALILNPEDSVLVEHI